jgi:DNA-binding response OmpR family regulator
VGGSRPSGDRPRQLGRVAIDPSSREMSIDGNPVSLRAREFDLLLVLADHVNQVLSRDQLLDQAWGYEYYGQTRTVDVHVAHLRDHLAGSGVEIETVWGRGYKLSIRGES